MIPLIYSFHRFWYNTLLLLDQEHYIYSPTKMGDKLIEFVYQEKLDRHDLWLLVLFWLMFWVLTLMVCIETLVGIKVSKHINDIQMTYILLGKKCACVYLIYSLNPYIYIIKEQFKFLRKKWERGCGLSCSFWTGKYEDWYYDIAALLHLSGIIYIS